MEKMQILIKFKEFIKDFLGLYVIILVIMAYFMYRQQLIIDSLTLKNDNLEEKYRTAYADGQDDAIRKVGEQIKVIQSLGVAINQGVEAQKQNNIETKHRINEAKRLNKQIDKQIQVNKESKELAKEACKLDAKTSEKLVFLVKLINKKVENDVLRSN